MTPLNMLQFTNFFLILFFQLFQSNNSFSALHNNFFNICLPLTPSNIYQLLVNNLTIIYAIIIIRSLYSFFALCLISKIFCKRLFISFLFSFITKKESILQPYNHHQHQQQQRQQSYQYTNSFFFFCFVFCVKINSIGFTGGW